MATKTITKKKRPDPAVLPKKVGMASWVSAHLLWLAIILLAIFRVHGFTWQLTIILASIIYFLQGSHYPVPKTIQAFTVWGKLAEDKQLESNWAFLWYPIERTSPNMKFLQRTTRIDFEIVGLTKDNWKASTKGFFEFRNVSAPKIFSIAGREVQIAADIKSMIARSAINPFSDMKAEDVEKNKHEILSTISDKIKEKLRIEKGYAHGDLALAEYGVDIERIVIEDPTLPDAFYIAAQKESEETFLGKGMVARNKKMGEAIDALTPSLKTDDQKLASTIIQRKEKNIISTEKIIRLEDPGNVIPKAAELIEGLVSKIDKVTERIVGTGTTPEPPKSS